MYATEKFVIEIDILRHQNKGLLNGLKNERKRRKRDKSLRLLDDGETDEQVLFFSPVKIERTRQRLQDQEQTEQQQRQIKEDNRIQRAILRSEKKREKKEKQLVQTQLRTATKEEKLRQKEEKWTERTFQ